MAFDFSELTKDELESRLNEIKQFDQKVKTEEVGDIESLVEGDSEEIASIPIEDIPNTSIEILKKRLKQLNPDKKEKKSPGTIGQGKNLAEDVIKGGRDNLVDLQFQSGRGLATGALSGPETARQFAINLITKPFETTKNIISGNRDLPFGVPTPDKFFTNEKGESTFNPAFGLLGLFPPLTEAGQPSELEAQAFSTGLGGPGVSSEEATRGIDELLNVIGIEDTEPETVLGSGAFNVGQGVGQAPFFGGGEAVPVFGVQRAADEILNKQFDEFISPTFLKETREAAPNYLGRSSAKNTQILAQKAHDAGFTELPARAMTENGNPSKTMNLMEEAFVPDELLKQVHKTSAEALDIFENKFQEISPVDQSKLANTKANELIDSTFINPVEIFTESLSDTKFNTNLEKSDFIINKVNESFQERRADRKAAYDVANGMLNETQKVGNLDSIYKAAVETGEKAKVKGPQSSGRQLLESTAKDSTKSLETPNIRKSARTKDGRFKVIEGGEILEKRPVIVDTSIISRGKIPKDTSSTVVIDTNGNPLNNSTFLLKDLPASEVQKVVQSLNDIIDFDVAGDVKNLGLGIKEAYNDRLLNWASENAPDYLDALSVANGKHAFLKETFANKDIEPFLKRIKRDAPLEDVLLEGQERSLNIIKRGSGYRSFKNALDASKESRSSTPALERITTEQIFESQLLNSDSPSEFTKEKVNKKLKEFSEVEQLFKAPSKVKSDGFTKRMRDLSNSNISLNETIIQDLADSLTNLTRPDKTLKAMETITGYKAVEGLLTRNEKGRNMFNSLKQQKLSDFIIGEGFDSSTGLVDVSKLDNVFSDPARGKVLDEITRGKTDELATIKDVLKDVDTELQKSGLSLKDLSIDKTASSLQNGGYLYAVLNSVKNFKLGKLGLTLVSVPVAKKIAIARLNKRIKFDLSKIDSAESKPERVNLLLRLAEDFENLEQ